MPSKYEAVSQSMKGSPLSEHRGTLIIAAIATLTVIVVVAVVLPVYFDVIQKGSNSNGGDLITYRLPLLSNLTESTTGLNASYVNINPNSFGHNATNDGPFFYCFDANVGDICSANKSAMYFGFDTYIVLPAAIGNITASYTFTFWMWGRIASTGVAYIQYVLFISDALVVSVIGAGNDPASIEFQGGGSEQTSFLVSEFGIDSYQEAIDAPFHVAWTFDNSTRRTVVYFDGAPNITNTGGPGWNGGGPLLVGGTGNVMVNFGGYLRYFTWSNYAWSAEQVQSEYNATLPS